MKILIIIICVSLMAISLFARNLNDDYINPVITDAPDMTLRVHRGSNIALSVSNYGKFGSEGCNLYDPLENPPAPAPSAEFPINSGIEYLFQGMIWIGAIVENPENPGQLDTLVSIGDDGWWASIHELNPLPPGNVSIWRDQYIGDEEYYAKYYDTLTTGVTQDPNDGRDHIPLGLKIVQHSLCWSTAGFDEFFVIEYSLENIFDRDLNDVWLGVYYDGDVYHISENPFTPEAGALDDLCGFIESGERGIAWMADNNGQPYDSDYTDISPTGIMGMMLLGSSVPEVQTNFNWWISSVYSQYDWSPQLQANYQGPFPGGGDGTPGGDIAKYRVMANGEHDYDQAYSALDWTDQGWIANHVPDPADLANGFETKYLISFGPFQIAAGEIETLAVALIGGNDFHTDPDNYSQNLQYNTSDSLSIALFYDNLDFSDLLAKADTILHYYNNGLDHIPPGYPPGFDVQSWNSSQITLTWTHREYPYLQEYRVYRGTQPGIYDPEKITPDSFTDTIFTDIEVEENTDYYYVISAATVYGGEGGYSAEVSIDPGKPQTPVGLEAMPGNYQVELSWQANDEADILGYIIYRNFEFQPDSLLYPIDTCLATSYLDYGLVNGLTYYYMIQAIDVYENRSFYSDTVAALPMGFDSGILLINANTSIPNNNPDYDSMLVFYNRLLANTSYQYTISNQEPYNLTEIAQYEFIIWVKDLIPGALAFSGSDRLIADYLDAGGKLLLAGPKLATSYSFEGFFDFRPGDFHYEYLNLDGVRYPDLLTTEFIGGQSLSEYYPDFAVDSVRANRIVVPPGENYGRLFGIGTLIPRDSTEVIYDFTAVNPDTSEYHGRPIGVIHHGENYIAASLEFPLYYVEEPVTSVILNQILRVLDEVSVDEPIAALPGKTSLLYNYPNPFNASTNIQFSLTHPSIVTIDIYDMLGRRVSTLVNEYMFAGYHSVVWRAEDLPSGIYFYKLQAGSYASSKSCILLK